MLHENDEIIVHLIDRPRRQEIQTRNDGEVFTIQKYPKTGKRCIDWKLWNGPLCGGDLFIPLAMMKSHRSSRRSAWSHSLR